MTDEEIKSIIHGVLAEQNLLKINTIDEDESVVLKTVAAILSSFGIDDEDRKEIRADFVHLRKWRKSVEQTQSYAFKTIVTVIVGGFLGAVWLGFKTIVGK